MNALTTSSTAEPARGELTGGELRILVEVARRAMETAVRGNGSWIPDPAAYPAALRRDAAVFVTLRRSGALRGCIGTMEARLPMVQAVADRAIAAAFHDPRFERVGVAELAGLTVDVSVLSPMDEFFVGGYQELQRILRPRIDGLLVESGPHRATFLPAVWDDLSDPPGFTAALWRKAGLPPGAWPVGIRTWRYTAQHGSEQAPDA